MNNQNVENFLDDCLRDLGAIEHLITGLGTSPVCSYLLKFAVILACSTIEQAFKTLIADYYEHAAPIMASFISCHVRDASKNPTFDVIYKQLSDFDSVKAVSFKTSFESLPQASAIKGLLTSLKNLRNDVAHGKSVTTSISDVKNYFEKSRVIIEELDKVLV